MACFNCSRLLLEDRIDSVLILGEKRVYLVDYSALSESGQLVQTAPAGKRNKEFWIFSGFQEEPEFSEFSHDDSMDSRSLDTRSNRSLDMRSLQSNRSSALPSRI